MANEELIYRITRAVYGRLGAEADERTVEALVTDIYRAVGPAAGAEAGARGEAGGDEGRSDRLIISVFGVDHPGIVAGVSQVLAEARCSIVDINQTVVQGKFAVGIVADISQARDSAGCRPK